MKPIILTLFFILVLFSSANSQIAYLDNWEDTPMNALVEFSKTYRPGLPEEYTGSFYLEKEFVPGIVEVEGEKKKLRVFLKYNALEDQVELKLKKNDKQVYLLPRMENIYYSTPSYDYVLRSFKTDEGKEINGYVIRYFSGDKVKFFAKAMAHLQHEVTPRSGYDRYKPAHMSIKNFYYLSVGDNPFTEVNLREKQIRKKLPKTSALKKYFSGHKLKTVEDFVKLLQFFEEQNSPNL